MRYHDSFPGVKRPGCEFDHSPAPNVEVKNESCTVALPVCLHGVYRDNCNFTFLPLPLFPFRSAMLISNEYPFLFSPFFLLVHPHITVQPIDHGNFSFCRAAVVNFPLQGYRSSVDIATGIGLDDLGFLSR
jgi:hypothetical protein